MASAVIYTLLNYIHYSQFIYAIAFVPVIMNMVKVRQNKDPRALDSELKKVALSTFAFAILFGFLHL